MSDCFERFKNRKVLSPVLSVEMDGATYKIERFSQVELTESVVAARARVTKQGRQVEDLTAEAFQSEVLICLADILKRHVQEIEHNGISIKDRKTIDGLFDEMSEGERLMLGIQWTLADQKDKTEKNALPQSGAGSSAKDSEANLSNQS